jgi:hypothetical protein
VRGYTIRSYYATLSKVFPSSLARTEKNATRRAQIISLSNKIQLQGILHITAARNLPRCAPNCASAARGPRTPAPSCDWPSQMPLRTPTPSLPHSALSRERLLEDCGCRDAYPECNRSLNHDRPLDWASPDVFVPHSFWDCEIKEAAVDINCAKWGRDVHLRLSFASEPTSPLRLATFARTKQSDSETRPASSTHGDETHTPHHKALC